MANTKFTIWVSTKVVAITNKISKRTTGSNRPAIQLEDSLSSPALTIAIPPGISSRKFSINDYKPDLIEKPKVDEYVQLPLN